MPDELRDLYAGLAALLRAGIPLRDAVRILRENRTLRGARGRALADAVDGGRSISTALDAPEEEVALVAAGEETGRLDESLDRLAALRTRSAAARRAFRAQLWYPLVLLHLAALLVPLPSTVWGPGFPWSWFARVAVVLGPFYGAILLVRLLSKTVAGRAALDRSLDRLPGFGAAARRRRRATFAVVLGAAYESGIPLDRAVRLAGNASGAAGRGESAAHAIAGGAPLTTSLAPGGLVATESLPRLQTAEAAGEIGKAIEAIAAEEGALADYEFTRSLFVLAKLAYFAMVIWIAWHVISFYGNLYAPLLR